MKRSPTRPRARWGSRDRSRTRRWKAWSSGPPAEEKCEWGAMNTWLLSETPNRRQPHLCYSSPRPPERVFAATALAPRRRRMTHKIIVLVISLCIGWNAEATMLRVISVDDAHTITIERDGARERLRLGGVEILDETRALDLLRWTLDSRWVMVEPAANGDHLVWRSPDALFINRELVVRGYARATLAAVAPESTLVVTYLGPYDPIGAPRTVTPAAGARTGSGTRPRSTARRSRSSGKRSSASSSGSPSPRSSGRSSGS